MLPLTTVRRIVEAYQENSPSARGEEKVSFSRVSVSALRECARVFIHYVCHEAAEKCTAKKRQTLSPADIYAALDELGLSEMVPTEALKEALSTV